MPTPKSPLQIFPHAKPLYTKVSGIPVIAVLFVAFRLDWTPDLKISLFVIEGTLVTDGMNVFYVMKPNNGAEVGADNDEIVVNIPIKGNNIIKPKGETKQKFKCSEPKRGK